MYCVPSASCDDGHEIIELTVVTLDSLRVCVSVLQGALWVQEYDKRGGFAAWPVDLRFCCVMLHGPDCPFPAREPLLYTALRGRCLDFDKTTSCSLLVRGLCLSPSRHLQSSMRARRPPPHEHKEDTSAGGSSDNPVNQAARGGPLKCAKEKNRYTPTVPEPVSARA